MAEIAEAASDIVLNDIPTNPIRRFDESRFDLDTEEFNSMFDSEAPAAWITMALLLRAQSVVGSIEVVTRAIVERVGKINWILDHEVDSRTRALRASLETAVSYQHYRRANDDLGADAEARRAIRREVRAQREQMERWFTFQKPLSNPCIAFSAPTADISQWSCGDETFPTFEKLAHYAMSDGDVERRTAMGTYGALSCFSHPNFVASREHRRNENDDPYIVYSYGTCWDGERPQSMDFVQ
jgi:hypothetical protein